MNVYGTIPRTPKEILDDQSRRYAYLESLINAEELNPDEDYDDERSTGILVKIAVSDLPEHFRRKLVRLLNIENDEE